MKVSIEKVEDTTYDRWKVSVAAGTGPDLLLFNNGPLIQEWARQGLMIPLDDYLSESMEGFSKTGLASLTVDGELYGIPYTAYTTALYYNKALLPEPPETMDELAQLVRQGKGLSLYKSAFFLFAFLTAFDGQLLDDEGRCIADLRPEFTEALEYLLALSEDGAVITSDWIEFTEPFKNGEVAMTINGLWILSDYQQALGDDLGVASIPRGSVPASPIAGVDAFIINPNSKYPQVAVDLALFLASPEAQADLSFTAIPVRTDLDLNDDDPRVVFFKAVESGYPDSWLTANFYGPFEMMFTDVFDNGINPATAVTDACRAMNALNKK